MLTRQRSRRVLLWLEQGEGCPMLERPKKRGRPSKDEVAARSAGTTVAGALTHILDASIKPGQQHGMLTSASEGSRGKITRGNMPTSNPEQLLWVFEPDTPSCLAGSAHLLSLAGARWQLLQEDAPPAAEQHASGAPIASSCKSQHAVAPAAATTGSSWRKARAQGYSGGPAGLVGRRLSVWWPDDKEHYQGTVTDYYYSSTASSSSSSDGTVGSPESTTAAATTPAAPGAAVCTTGSKRKGASTGTAATMQGKHRVQYDDGDVELLDLCTETWQLTDLELQHITAINHQLQQQGSEGSKQAAGSADSGSVLAAAPLSAAGQALLSWAADRQTKQQLTAVVAAAGARGRASNQADDSADDDEAREFSSDDDDTGSDSDAGPGGRRQRGAAVSVKWGRRDRRAAGGSSSNCMNPPPAPPSAVAVAAVLTTGRAAEAGLRGNSSRSIPAGAATAAIAATPAAAAAVSAGSPVSRSSFVQQLLRRGLLAGLSNLVGGAAAAPALPTPNAAAGGSGSGASPAASLQAAAAAGTKAAAPHAPAATAEAAAVIVSAGAAPAADKASSSHQSAAGTSDSASRRSSTTPAVYSSNTAAAKGTGLVQTVASHTTPAAAPARVPSAGPAPTPAMSSAAARNTQKPPAQPMVQARASQQRPASADAKPTAAAAAASPIAPAGEQRHLLSPGEEAAAVLARVLPSPRTPAANKMLVAAELLRAVAPSPAADAHANAATPHRAGNFSSSNSSNGMEFKATAPVTDTKKRTRAAAGELRCSVPATTTPAALMAAAAAAGRRPMSALPPLPRKPQATSAAAAAAPAVPTPAAAAAPAVPTPAAATATAAGVVQRAASWQQVPVVESAGDSVKGAAAAAAGVTAKRSDVAVPSGAQQLLAELQAELELGVAAATTADGSSGEAAAAGGGGGVGGSSSRPRLQAISATDNLQFSLLMPGAAAAKVAGTAADGKTSISSGSCLAVLLVRLPQGLQPGSVAVTSSSTALQATYTQDCAGSSCIQNHKPDSAVGGGAGVHHFSDTVSLPGGLAWADPGAGRSGRQGVDDENDSGALVAPAGPLAGAVQQDDVCDYVGAGSSAGSPVALLQVANGGASGGRLMVLGRCCSV